MTAGGYVGRHLFLDLSLGLMHADEPAESLRREFIGGYGLGARVLYSQMSPGADPLGPQNVLGFVTGPLTGTPALMASRYCVVGKSPLTGGWGDANSGGEFGPALKAAGFDAVFVRGISPEPAYLLIEDGHAEVRSAHDLWGLDTLDTEEWLKTRHGENVRVACIGPAGERLTRFAAIINDRGRAAARSGLGAVMGAKRLKAVAVRGRNKPTVADPDRVKELRRRYLELFKQDGYSQTLRRYGTSGVTRALVTRGRTPIKNWRGAFPDDFRNVDALDGPAVADYEIKKYTCWHCNQSCGGILRWERDGHFHQDHRPEYETLAGLGTYCAIDDLTAVMSMNAMCNRAGLDTISSGATIAFAMECYENDLFSEDELGGLALNWGDSEMAIALLQRIIDRQGLGDLLAEGIQRASQKLGRGSESYAIHAGGQALPAHDPRQHIDFGLAYQMSPTPGRHTQGGIDMVNMSPDELQALGVDLGLRDLDPVLFHAKAYAAGTAWTNVLNAAGLCAFGSATMPLDYVPNFVSAITGWDFDMPECLKTGERIEVIRHLFGLREGRNPLHTRITPRAMGIPALKSGPTAGVTVNMEHLRREYLKIMNWDTGSSVPHRCRLEYLGLDSLDT